MKIKRAITLLGRKIAVFSGISAALGLALGVSEIIFSFALAFFLYKSGLAPLSSMPQWLPFESVGALGSLILAGICRSSLWYSVKVITTASNELFNARIRERLLTLLKLKSEIPIHFSASDVSNILATLMPKAASFTFAIFQIITSILAFSITLIALLKLSMQLTAVAIGASLLFGLPIIFAGKFYQRHSAQCYAYSSKFTTRLLKDLRNLEFLRILGKGTSESAQLAGFNDAITHNHDRYNMIININSAWPQFGAVCMAATVVIAGTRYHLAEASVLISFVYLLSRLAVNTSEVSTNIGSAQFCKPFFAELMKVLERLEKAESLNLESHHNESNLIAVGSIKRLQAKQLSIGRDSTLVEGLSFDASPGDFICFTGDSGRGKTTLLMTLIGILPHRGGQLLWNDIGIDQINKTNLQSKVAYSGPDPFLLDISVQENLLFGNESLNPSDTEIHEALRLAGCDFVKNLPQGLGHRLREGGEGVSAGQKQRLSLARAILRRPDILLLDEATANLDIELEEVVIKNLKSALPHAIILAVSHRPTILKFATQRIAL